MPQRYKLPDMLKAARIRNKKAIAELKRTAKA
jgi:hypothetical protein